MHHDTSDLGIAFAAITMYLTFILAIIAVMIWLYWRIFTKAGYNGALSLLNLVPGVGGLVVILILAFGRWPIEDRLAAAGGSYPGAVPPYPPSSGPPPGSAITPS